MQIRENGEGTKRWLSSLPTARATGSFISEVGRKKKESTTWSCNREAEQTNWPAFASRLSLLSSQIVT